MENDSTVYVGLDVHKDSITVAYALGTGEVELLGKIGTTKTDIDRLSKRLQSKARHAASSTRQAHVATAFTGNWSRRDSTVWCAHRR